MSEEYKTILWVLGFMAVALVGLKLFTIVVNAFPVTL